MKKRRPQCKVLCLVSPTTRRGRETVASGSFFANSLLSLTSPLDLSRAARCRRLRIKCPPPVVPPPLPRRNSDPNTYTLTITHSPKRRRHSEYKNPNPDLRQELVSLDLNQQEVSTWLGNKYEERIVEESEFGSENSDVPLQRSLSLDGGIEIFNYLQNMSEGWSLESLASSWTVHSHEDRNAFERYQSNEDIPTSPNVRSRRVSLEEGAIFGQNLAKSVLKSSYKGLDEGSGIMYQEMKKLQRNFSFSSWDDVKKSEVDIKKNCDVDNERTLVYRDISLPSKIKLTITTPSVMGMKRQTLERNLSQQCQGIKKSETNLRKDVLKNNLSCDNLTKQNSTTTRRNSLESRISKNVLNLGLTLLKDSYKGIDLGNGDISPNIKKLKRNFSFRNSADLKELSTPNIPNIDSNLESSVAKKENLLFPKTSSTLDLSSDCDCQICRESTEVEKGSLFSRIFRKLFTNVVVDERRRTSYWDENNNLNEGEMYSCIMHIFKLMLGLWLRHLDHN